jgi:ribonuclease T2
MTQVMPTRGLADYQWRKHGSCSGWSPSGYAEATVKAASGIERPVVEGPEVHARGIWRAYREANPDLPRESFAVVCRGDYIYEVRICLDRALRPMDCVQTPRRNCSGPKKVPPVL